MQTLAKFLTRHRRDCRNHVYSGDRACSCGRDAAMAEYEELMSKREQNIGSHGQNLAATILAGMGVLMVEKIGTPVLLIPASPTRRDVFQVRWGEKVSGDHRGILPGGRSVLAETKTILDRNLRWSDLREHQPERLALHADHGGLSLLVWVHASGVYVMRFPVDGFGVGKSISPQQAQAEHKFTCFLLSPVDL